MPGNKAPAHPPTFALRLTVLAVCMVAGLALLGVRLWSMQVVNGASYRLRAETERIRPQRVQARRGTIYGVDAGREVVLADSRPAYDLMVVPGHCDDQARVCRQLETLTGIDGDALLARMKKERPFRQIEVKRDIAKEELIRIEEHGHELSGVFVNVRPERSYPYRHVGGQLLGYLGEINGEELARRRANYQLGDFLGRSGLEQAYEPMLRGTDGRMTVVVSARDQRPQVRTDAHGNPYFDVDSFGRPLDEVKSRQVLASPGEPVHLSLDIGLQAFCEQLLEGEHGAIVVMNADTGEVLALASQPTFDPSVFVTKGMNQQRNELFKMKPSPMRNACYEEQYAPGSTVKIMMAAAALEAGVITPTSTHYCPGVFRLSAGGNTWRCWKKGGHGTVNVVEAITYSCDVFFYNVGRALGVEKIKEYATRMGLGVASGLDVPGEVPGIIPDEEWKRQEMARLVPDDPSEWRWYPGDTINISIGQGFVAIPPIQLAVLTATVVNGGYRVTPHLWRDAPVERVSAGLSEATLALVREGMFRCVDDTIPPSGTGHLAKVEGITVLGKTGTAQVVKVAQYKDLPEEQIPYPFRDHAWFIAGVPDREPRLAMTIFVAHGLHGSSGAAPLAKSVIEFFYNRQPEPLTIAKAGERP